MHKALVLLFDAFFFVLLAAAMATARQWPFATGLFPLTVGIPVLLVALVQLARDAVAGPDHDAESPAPRRVRDIAVDRSVPADRAIRRAGAFYLCALALLASVLLVGFQPALALFLALYLRLVSRAGWGLTLTLAGLVTALVVGVFDNVLYVVWPESLLGHLIGAGQS